MTDETTFSLEKGLRTIFILSMVLLGSSVLGVTCVLFDAYFYGKTKLATSIVTTPVEKKEEVLPKTPKKKASAKKVDDDEVEVEEEKVDETTIFFNVSFRTKGPPRLKDPSYNRLMKPVKTALTEYGIDYCDLEYEKASLTFSVDVSNEEAVQELLEEKFLVERLE
jgi:hypothetical protein